MRFSGSDGQPAVSGDMTSDDRKGGGTAAAAAGRGGAMIAIAGFVSKTVAITEVELRKLRHDPWELLTRAVQPTLWLLVFGQVFNTTRAIPTGSLSYLEFMAPGILAQSVLFVAIFYGIVVIWERDLGIVHKFLVSPAPRGALVLGKALSAGVRGISQAIIIYLLALALGIRMVRTPLSLLGVVLMVILGSAFFSTFSLIVACLVKTRERFMGIGQVLTMPLFFGSNAIYPISMMPRWLQVISRVNPLTYEVDALRLLMAPGSVTTFGLATDFGVVTLSMVALVTIAARLYPRVVT